MYGYPAGDEEAGRTMAKWKSTMEGMEKLIARICLKMKYKEKDG